MGALRRYPVHLVERFQVAIIAHDKTALEGMFVAEGDSWFELPGPRALK